jgi:hypothetical protein
VAAAAARVLPESLGPKAWSEGRARPRPAGAPFRDRFERGEI